MLTKERRKELEAELKDIMRPKGYTEAEMAHAADRGSQIIRMLIDDEIVRDIHTLGEPLTGHETMLLATQLGFRPHAGHPVTQVMLQRWLRREWNHNIVPVRVPSDFDNSENHKIYLNGREWYCEGLYVVVEGYEACLEAGLKKSLRYLLNKQEKYNESGE